MRSKSDHLGGGVTAASGDSVEVGLVKGYTLDVTGSAHASQIVLCIARSVHPHSGVHQCSRLELWSWLPCGVIRVVLDDCTKRSRDLLCTHGPTLVAQAPASCIASLSHTRRLP
jgi:hypothetical protein